MSPCRREVGVQYPVIASRGGWLLRGLIWILLGAPAFASLVSIDRTLPITSIEGNPFTLGGDVTFDTPMRLRFAFDSANPASVTSGTIRSYTFASEQTSAALSFGDLSWEMKPFIQLNLYSNGTGYFGDRVMTGDILSISASTLPAPSDSFYVVMSATFLFPVGTFSVLDPVVTFPGATPIAIDLSSIVHEADTDSALFRALDYPSEHPPFSAVPEPNMFGLTGAIVLGLGTLRRLRRERTHACGMRTGA